MNEFEDGMVALGLDGLFEGHAVPTSNLQEAVFFPFDNVIPENLLRSCILLACKRYTEQEVMNVSSNSVSELCVVVHRTGVFYSDENMVHTTDDIQQAFVFDRSKIKKLDLNKFLVPVRMRSVFRLELHHSQPTHINPFMQKPSFDVNANGIVIDRAYITGLEVTQNHPSKALVKDGMSEGPTEGADIGTLTINGERNVDTPFFTEDVSLGGKVDEEYLDNLTGQVAAHIDDELGTPRKKTKLQEVLESAEVDQLTGQVAVTVTVDKGELPDWGPAATEARPVPRGKKP